MGFYDNFIDKQHSGSILSSIKRASVGSVLRDKKLGLVWERVTYRNLDKHKSYFGELSDWSCDADIKKYVSGNFSLDKLFMDSVTGYSKIKETNKFNLYFCCNKEGGLVGLVYMTSPIGRNTSSTMEYIIVNPRYRGKGVGTKMVESVNNNLDFFNNWFESDGVFVSVQSENIASSRVFLKNNYKKVSYNCSGTGRFYNVYYFSSRNADVESVNGK